VEESIIFIGLIEEDHNRCILDITKELLILSNYQVVYENINGDIIGISNGNQILIIFDLISSELRNMDLNKFCFDIIVHSYIDNSDLFHINNLFKMSKICILNCDEGDMVLLVSKLENVIAITYGLNSKATITISSYNIDPYIEANLCLQRDIIPINGEKIEPFEFSLEMNSDNDKLIYPVLAAATLNLLLGDSILNKKPYKNIKLII